MNKDLTPSEEVNGAELCAENENVQDNAQATEHTECDTPVLRCVNLNKCYTKGKYVLKDFTIDIPKGKIVGLLGPNGCGKSTLLKLISGLLTEDSGEIEICGIKRSEETNALISYLPERTYFNSRMRVFELLDYFADFYSDFDRALAEKLLTDLNIPTDQKLKELSKGMKEKVQLVMVMAKTRLYLLDEPIGGVDPASRDYILDTIIGSYNPEATIIITTHLIHDIEPALNEFLFMGYGGTVLRKGNAEAIRQATGKTLDELFREEFRYAGQGT